jgi:hypothetical protein
MSRPVVTLFAVLAMSASASSFADACYVVSDPGMAGPSGAREERCFEHSQMPSDSMDWSCRTIKDSQNIQREKRASCPQGFFGKCVAELTQESLANELSVGQRDKQPFESPQIPAGAQVTTYHYRALDGAQAKVDCEKAGGQWQEETAE